MKQYLLRRRRCWTLLVQMDLVIHLVERHRSDMLLDLSGLTREEFVVVQAPMNNARDVDRVAEPLIIQHRRIHLRECQRRKKGKAKTGSTVAIIQTIVNFVERQGKHTRSGKSGASAYCTNYTSIEDYDYDDDTSEPADAHQAHNDPIHPDSDDGEEVLNMMLRRKMTRFLRMLLWMMSLFWRQLNRMQLLFLPTRGTMILTLK